MTRIPGSPTGNAPLSGGAPSADRPRSGRFGAFLRTDAPRVSRFGARPVADPQNLKEFIGPGAETMTPEMALGNGDVQRFVDHLRQKAEGLPADSPERTALGSTIAGLQSELGEFNSRAAEARARNVSPATIDRLNSPLGAAEQSIAQTAVGQTAMRVEQGLSNIAEAGLSLVDRAAGSGRMSAAIHFDKKRRDEFLTEAERGGQIENTLGDSGSRIYNGVVGSVAKFSAAGLAGPAAVYSLIAGEGYDNAKTEAAEHGLTGIKGELYAGSKAAVETALTLLMGKLGQRLGVSSFEETLSPAMREQATKLVAQAVGKSAFKRMANEAAGVGMESAEELLVDAVQQGIELQAGTSKGFDWKRLLEAGASGAGARGATGVLSTSLRSIPSQKIEETVAGVAAAEQALEAVRRGPLDTANDRAAFERIAAHQVQVEDAAGARGLNRALTFIQKATPEMLAKAAEPLNAKQFRELTGIKKTSELFRAAFRDTLGVYARLDRSPAGTAIQAPTSPVDDPQAAGTAPEPPTAASSPNAVAGPSGQLSTTSPGALSGANRANVDAGRDLLGLPAIPDAASQPWASAIDVAKTNRVPDRAMTIARELMIAPRGLSPVETAGLVVKSADLKNQYDTLQDRISASTDEADTTAAAAEQQRILDEFDELSTALRTSGTEKGRALAAQKLTINRAYDLVSVTSRARAAAQQAGNELTPSQKAALGNLTADLATVEQQIAQHKGTEAELAELEVKRDKLKREIKFKIDDLKPKSLWTKVSAPFHASRALIASTDFSAVLRQGGFVTFSRPDIAMRALAPMWRAARSEVEAAKINAKILAQDRYRTAKLFLHDENADMTGREESFLSRWLATPPDQSVSEAPLHRKADVAARHVLTGTQRAYTTFLNLVRADAFDAISKTLAKNGEPTLAEQRAIASYVNVATGRGGLGKFDRSLTDMATIFFAPRYVVSRFQLLAAPLTGFRSMAGPDAQRVRAQIAREYARYGIGMALMYSTASLLWGDDEGFSISFDPRSSEFGKINFNGTRLDPMAGLAQVTTFLGRIGSGQTKNARGQVSSIRGADARMGSTAADVTARYLRTKLAPLPGMALDVLSGKNVIGEPVTPGTILVGSTVPLSLRDISEAIEQQGLPRGAAMGVAALLGAGLQSYRAQ